MTDGPPSIALTATVQKCQNSASSMEGGNSRFSDRLNEKSGSTSTPILPRTRSATEITPERHDSGFTELLSLTYSQDLHSREAELSDYATASLTQSQTSTQSYGDKHSCSQTDTGYGDSVLSCTTSESLANSARSTADLDGLRKMQNYYDNLNKICQLDKVIGKRIGSEHVDIISELHKLQIPSLSAIFSFLGDQDLKSCMMVSNIWKQAMSENSFIKAKLSSSKESRTYRLNKENTSPKKNETLPAGHVPSGIPLSSIQLTTNIPYSKSTSVSSPEESNDTTLFKRFTKEASKLKVGEKLMKCARCSAPAKLYSEAKQAKCTRSNCKYDFCTVCELEFHGARDCITQRNKKTRVCEQPINSRKSKRQLKRL